MENKVSAQHMTRDKGVSVGGKYGNKGVFWEFLGGLSVLKGPWPEKTGLFVSVAYVNTAFIYGATVNI